MSDELPKVEEPKTNGSQDTSQIFGVSVRGWLVTMMVVTVCVICGFGKEVPEPLYTGFLTGLGFYLGQKFNKA